MKILLREHQGEQFVWHKAKYNGTYFVVQDNYTIREENIVSVMNDNRKNYIKCSSCGAIISKKGNAFAKHKEESCGISPCIDCRQLRVDYFGKLPKKQYVQNDDGTYIEKSKGHVKLLCNYRTYENAPLDYPEVIRRCPKRQCVNANGDEIVDTFTTFPGLFDEIITVDKLLDCEGVTRVYYGDTWSEYLLSDKNDIRALVNSLGIVDRFFYDIGFESNTLYYSKKYKALFRYDNDGEYSKYTKFTENDSDYYEEIKTCIEKLYK